MKIQVCTNLLVNINKMTVQKARDYIPKTLMVYTENNVLTYTDLLNKEESTYF